MTTAHHTPLAVGGPLTSVAMEAPLSQLDAAIATVIATGSGASTTLTAQANSGQKNMVVVDRAGWLVGDVFWIGVAGGTYETGTIASGTGAGAGTLVAVANLANTYPIGTPVSKSPIEIVQARGVHPTLGARLASYGFGFLSALDYGVKADGTTDDTTACQAALDALISSSAKGIVFPAGTIRITAALVIGSTAYQYKTIHGLGWGITIIRQDTSNLPIFKTATENTHSIEFGEMTIGYNTQQTAANTGAIALCFTKPTAGTAQGWYWWRVHRLLIDKAHIGIGIGGPGATGSLPVWNCLFENITMTNVSQTAINMVSPSAAGMPVSLFRAIAIFNGGVTSAGTCIIHHSEAIYDGLDIEDWHGRLVYTWGGRPLQIRGLHTERHKCDTAAIRLFEVSEDELTLENAILDFEVTGGVATTVFSVGPAGRLTVRGVQIAALLTSGTVIGLSQDAAAGDCDIRSIADINNNVPFGLGIDIDYIAPFDPRLVNAASVSVANEAYLYAFRVPRTVRVGKARVDVDAGAGNIDVGIYNHAGTRLASTGSTAMAGGPTSQQIALTTSVLLNPGKKYYAAIVLNGAVGTLRQFSGVAPFSAGALGIATKVAASFPLPSTIAVGVASASRMFAICFEP